MGFHEAHCEEVTMKVSIKTWAGNGAVTLLEGAGFIDGQEISEESMYDVARTLFDHGFNVMLYHKSDTDVVLFLDTKRFSQR